MTEEWREVSDWRGVEVSCLGRVRHRGTIVAPRRHSQTGRLRVQVLVDGKRSDRLVNRLVWETFTGTTSARRHLHHRDGNLANCALDNLVLRTEAQHCVDCGTPLSDDTARRAPDGGFTSRCSPCGQRERRRRHDVRENARRLGRDTNCEICGDAETVTRGGRVRRPTLDHDHDSGAARGVLCSHCNAGLGMFRDSPERLRAAADYLERYRSQEEGAA